MSRLVPALLTTLAVMLFAHGVRAQESMYEGDPDQKMKEDIEKIYGVYIINPSRRHSDEKVHITTDKRGRQSVELRVFYDQRRKAPERMKCFAFRWLLLGRFGEGGSRELFARYPKVDNADIMFYTLASKRTVDSAGKYSVAKEPVWFIRGRLTRDKAKKLDWQELEKDLAIDGTKCANLGEKAVSFHKYRRYLDAENRDP